MLFLARAKNQAIALAPEEIGIGRALSAVVDLYEPAASEAGVSLDIVVANPSLTVWGDRLLILRALGNLVSNAIRHTPRGGTVTIAAATDKDGALITVTSSGAGIAAEHLPHIFDRFCRADPSRSGERSGLGLAIVKAIVVLHGGDVRIISMVGRGTQVTITALPGRR